MHTSDSSKQECWCLPCAPSLLPLQGFIPVCTADAIVSDLLPTVQG